MKLNFVFFSLFSCLLFCMSFFGIYGNADTITFVTSKGEFTGPWIGGDHKVNISDGYELIFGSQTLVTSEGFTNRFFYGVFKTDTDFLFENNNLRKSELFYKDSGVKKRPPYVHFSRGPANNFIFYSDSTNGDKGSSLSYKMSNGRIISTSFAGSLIYYDGSEERLVYNVKLYGEGLGFSEKDLTELEVFNSDGYGFSDYSLDYNKMIELGINAPRKKVTNPDFNFFEDFGGSLLKLLFDSDGISSRLMEISRVFSQFDIRKPLFSVETGPSGYEIDRSSGLGKAVYFFGWGEVSRSMIWSFQEWVLICIQALYFYRKIQTLGASVGSVYSGVSYIVRD